jgi:NADH-quinone oxidoreductase subunit N
VNLDSLGLAAFTPELVLSLAVLVVLLVGAFSRDGRYAGLPGGALILVAIILWWRGVPEASSFAGQYGGDGPSYFARGFFLCVALVMTWLAAGGQTISRLRHAEFLTLMYISVLGMMVMASSQNWAMVFLGLETMSIPLYVMAAYLRTQSASVEAGVKYFIYGAFASAFFVYGLALVFVSLGTLDQSVLYESVSLDPLAVTGLLLIMVGLAFKIAAVPFHMWAPDAYAGAPTLVTSFFAVAPKAAGFIALYRLVSLSFQLAGPDATVALVTGLSALSIIVGNLGALVQSRLKRMLAYSSIAHAGYLLMALVAIDTGGTAALLFYLVAYALMTTGSFVVLLVFERDGAADTYEQITGGAYRRPILGLAMTVFMISLAGIPATVGFMGKFQIFRSLLEGGHFALVLVAVGGTLVSVAYYLRVVVYLYMHGESDLSRATVPRMWPAVATVLAVAVLVLGLFPQLLWPTLEAWSHTVSHLPAWAGP